MIPCSVGGRKAIGGLLDTVPWNYVALLDLPTFLCPTLLRSRRPRRQSGLALSHTTIQRYHGSRRLHTERTKTLELGSTHLHTLSSRLPVQCPGCGALSQTSEKNEAGYYSTSRRAVRDYLCPKASKSFEEAQTLSAALDGLDEDVVKSLGINPAVLPNSSLGRNKTPVVCDRCHQLLHHQIGVSIHHPTIESIADTISETPHKYNHVYHVIDAADFPMSLIPGIHKLLNLTPQRSLNRRANKDKYYHGKKTEMSFIITRSDLLAPLKAQVDHMMPYLTDVLRDALGSKGKDVRLGNVRCVSAKRSWWTKELKEDVWRRGGAGWMVGKVNVGKSQLFESIFPKGRRGHIEARKQLTCASVSNQEGTIPDQVENVAQTESDQQGFHPLDVTGILPPAPSETDYPVMPLVSSLPGTTASPIRVLFGNGKGELIDLPGLSRGELELHVQNQHRQTLVMKSRITPEQQVIKPGQSLLLGGLVRITPITPDTVFLAYSFMPIASHLTSTEKAIGIQTRQRDTTVQNIAHEDIAIDIGTAGRFRLQWDVTKDRSGPLTRKSDVNLDTAVLPYVVYSADILIEGCGWVELVAQVRKRTMQMQQSAMAAAGAEFVDEDELESSCRFLAMPEVEVFSPQGKHIGIRRPMGAWLLNHKPIAANAKGRPRRSMKSEKRNHKLMLGK